jgi:intracellular sulfur oxidation DsrE/DsrF family protein
MPPNRRTVFTRALALLAGGGAVLGAARAGTLQPAKVVYHLSDVDKVAFVLGNIRNHINGEGGPENVEIILVVHGPALAFFRTSRAAEDTARRLAEIAADGVTLNACGNTLKAQNIEVSDLLPGFVRVDEGGVVRLARLQAEGYAYLRP